MATIGIDARMIFYTGIGRHVLNLVTRIPRLDPDNDYRLFVRPEDEKRIAELIGDENPRVTCVPTVSSIYNLREQTTHLRILQQARLDLLHVPHFNIPILYRGKLIVTIHDLIQAHFPSQETANAGLKRLAYKLVISLALRKAQRISVVSKYTRDDIIRTFHTPAEKIEVIYNGIDECWEKTTYDAGLAEHVLARYGVKKPFLLYVGLSSLHKNLLRLIEAMQFVRKHSAHDIQLAIAGKKDPRYLPQLEAKIKELHLEQAVVFTDFLGDADLKIMYNSAEAFVFPSLYEGFGLPPLEALQSGLPVVSSNATSLPEVLGDAATYFDPTSVLDMAKAITSVLKDKKNIPVYTKRFSWDVFARQTLELYKSVLATDGQTDAPAPPASNAASSDGHADR
ncbi:MAG TPA: glycosyltransferase family 1 protein [bacterium]|nr:glycosyltransferase family 1 protein [bacterium]